jgi:RNA polymerase sigma-70 factor (ECF subfamily)
MGKRGLGAELDEIELIYRTRLAELRRVATAITGSREAGCDAVQDAFALAVYRRDDFRGDGSLDGWVWRIVVHRSRDIARSAAGRLTTPIEYSTRALAAEPVSSGSESAVQRLVAELPERQRLVLFLHYYADLGYGAIAEALEVSPGTVGATLLQARDRLRQLMTGVSS